MKTDVKLLDCTLRDGAYVVNGIFGETAIRGIIDKLQEAEVDIVECGWLKNGDCQAGSTYFHTPEDIKKYIKLPKNNTIYSVMIDWDRYDPALLPPYDGKTIDAIRVVFPFEHYTEGIEVGKAIKEKGYKIFFQAANTLAYSEKDLSDLAKKVNESAPEALSIVDTFGAMYEEDLDRIVDILDATLDKRISLGFHSHNNQQLSFALTMHFCNLLKSSGRTKIVDSSLCGMGRGAGNATTELLVNFLNKKCNGHYDMDAIMNAIDIYMNPFLEKYSWGYSTPYFIAGMYCCHVNNITYLVNTHHTSATDMRNIIESMSPVSRRKYDYDLLESHYHDNQNRYVDDRKACEFLYRSLQNRDIVLVAPGKTALCCREKIQEHINANNSVVIGVNALVEGFDYDFLFFVNAGRYDYARNNTLINRSKAVRILLSNIKTEGESNEVIIGYNNVIKRGWEHFDNAVICALRAMDFIGIEKVSIAGFDGFKKVYNESYADPGLPSLNPGNKWDELNKEIKDMFEDFRINAKTCKDIRFLTESIFCTGQQGETV